MNKVVVVNGQSIIYQHGVYPENGGVYMEGKVIEGEDKGKSIVSFTICLPVVHLNENEIIVPFDLIDKQHYSAFKKLMVEEEIEFVFHGFRTSRKVRLKQNWKELAEEIPLTQDDFERY